ncbi:MAG: PH domain-containing protein [Schleiferiaceae bacterium]|nr:PH domain-containing protein [Schleiferiaceae bacterium]
METKVAELFNNVLVLPENLPDAEAIAFTPIEKRYLWFSRLRFVIGLLLPVPFWIFSEMGLTANVLILIGYSLLFGFTYFTHWMSFKRKGYAIRTHDISFRTGWLFRSFTVVPFNRVQHCEVESGPIERLFALSTLKVFTAGGSGSDITIPGLEPATAKKLRAHIISTAAAHEEH